MDNCESKCAERLEINMSEISLVPTASHLEIDSPSGAIPCHAWGCAAQARAAVVLVHGLGSHGGWFEPAGRYFKINGIYAMAYDQAGFGLRESGLPRTYNDWIKDLKTIFTHVHNQMDGRPVFVLGNSMGALISAAAAPSLSPSGLILTAPAFAGYPASFTPWFTLTTLITALVNPRALVAEPCPIELISRSSQVQEWIVREVGPRLYIPAGIFLQVYWLIKDLIRKLPLIDCPLFMLTAEKEFIVDNKVSMQVFEKLNNPSKIHKEFPGAYHDLLLDPLLESITGEIITWMYKCTPKAATVAG